MNKPVDEVFWVTDYQAKGDGESVDTSAIQAAIDACHRAGGGRVVLPPGRYVTSTLYLKDQVRLCLQGGAELLGSRKAADYPMDNPGSGEIGEPCSGEVLSGNEYIQALIVAHKASNVAIEGPGVIDGRGQQDAFPALINGKKDGTQRPMLIRFVQCTNIRFHQVTLKDASSWCLHLVDCDDVHIQAIKISNRANRNNDGIDLDGCGNVFIADCQISAKDDAICLKSSSGRSCENVFVRNCVLSSDTAGIKLGTSSRAGFKNVIVSDCVIRKTAMAGIKLICVDGGTLDNVHMHDLVMEDVEGPIFIRLGNRGAAYFTPEPDGGPIPVGCLRNVTLRNIQARVRLAPPDTDEVQEHLRPFLRGGPRTRLGMLMTGIPGHPLTGLKLDNIDILFPGLGDVDPRQPPVPDDEKRYPEQCFFGPLPAYGLFLRHAEDVELSRIRLRYEGHEKRPAMILDDVHECSLKDVTLQADGACAMQMQSVSDIAVSGCRVRGKPASLIAADAEDQSRICLDHNRLDQGTQPFSLPSSTI